MRACKQVVHYKAGSCNGALTIAIVGPVDYRVCMTTQAIHDEWCGEGGTVDGVQIGTDCTNHYTTGKFLKKKKM